MISLRRFAAVFAARNKEFLRDRGALAWNLAFPLFAVFGMAFVFSGRGRDVFQVGVIGPVAGLPADFLATQYIKFIPFDDAPTAEARLRRHQLDLLVRPGEPMEYQVNETSPKGYLAERLLIGSMGRRAYRRRAVTGREIRYVDWLVSGLLGMNMMFSALFGVGYTIVRYRKNGVLKRLRATPLSALEFLAAQIVSRLTLIMAVLAIVYHGADAFLHFRRVGSLFDVYLIFALGAVCLISLGLLVAARATSEELAGGLLNLLSWPMMFLSGVWFSLEGSPPSLRLVAKIFPLTHVVDAARAVMTEGATLSQVSGSLAALTAMTVVFLTVSALTFRWE